MSETKKAISRDQELQAFALFVMASARQRAVDAAMAKTSIAVKEAAE